MKIITDEAILRKANTPVTIMETKNIVKLAKQMFDLMVANEGCGIAGCQVGINKTFFLARIDGRTRLFINPKIIETSGEDEMNSDVEGCLSVPGFYGTVKRHNWVVVTYHNGERRITEKFEGFNARVVQHEYQHLQGEIYTDIAEEMFKKEKLG